MNIIVDIWHPAEVHFFKNFIWRMKNSGHQVLVTSRNKDVIVGLLDNYGIEHTTLSIKGKGFWGLPWNYAGTTTGCLSWLRNSYGRADGIRRHEYSTGRQVAEKTFYKFL